MFQFEEQVFSLVHRGGAGVFHDTTFACRVMMIVVS